MNRPTVFIHSNEQQRLGTGAEAHSLRRHRRRPEWFDVRIRHPDDTPQRRKRDGQRCLHSAQMTTRHDARLQSFSLLRMMVPQVIGCQGGALTTDPEQRAAR